MNGRVRHRGVAVAALLAVAMTSAENPAATPGDTVTIPDGEWHGVIVGSSTVDFGVATGGGSYSGEMTLSADAGAVDGTFTIKGVAAVAGPDGYGTGELEESGVVSGSATAPLVQPTDGSMHMVLTVAGHTFEQTMPVAGSPWALELTEGDCGTIVARWSASDAGMTGEGTVVLTPVIDMTPEATDYMDRLVELWDDISAYTAAATSGAAEPGGLGDLAARARSLQQAMRRNEECGLRPAGGLDELVSHTIQQLLDFALANPGAVSDIDLQMTTNAAAEAGLVGPSSPGGGANTQTEQLLAEWGSRLDEFVAAGDSIGVATVAAIADVLGDAGLAEDAAVAADSLGG